MEPEAVEVSRIITLRIWGELEEWYDSLPEKEKSAHVRAALRRGIQAQTEKPGPLPAPEIKVKAVEVKKEINLEDLEVKLDSFDF